jgi:acetyl esterase/lipase
MAGCGAGSPTHEPCLGSQTVDVYLPRGSVSRGTLLLIHGGGFVSGDKRDLTGLGPLLHQTDRGWGVVVVNYRLARVGQGVHPFPTALQDVADAVRWVRDHGRSVGLDPARVVAAGHSAGGTLAALLGVAWNAPRAEYAGVPRVDGWVSVAGILEPSSGAMSRSWFGLWAGPWAPSWYAAAPATWIDPTDPPGWIIHGDRDRFVEPENARRMIDAARRTGSGSVSLDVVDRWHGGAAQPEAHRSHSPMGGANLAALESWLDAR